MNKVSNILVTGSKGFIGKNLLKKLYFYNFNVLEFKRGDSFEYLESLILKCDFIIHLAAEVRPNSSDDEFKKSNSLLTQKIISIITKNRKSIPILLASTVHAEFLKNEYGKTKREAEILVENYLKNTRTNCFIYRIPHIFGEGCKPNYNSVISTWIYNSINNLKINCFDRNIQMNYVYVQDIVDEFIEIIRNNTLKSLYITPNNIYNTTLGEVIDFIEEFKVNSQNKNHKTKNKEFKQKLYNTYLDYEKGNNV